MAKLTPRKPLNAPRTSDTPVSHTVVTGMNPMQQEKYALWDLERAVCCLTSEVAELQGEIRDLVGTLDNLCDRLKKRDQ